MTETTILTGRDAITHAAAHGLTLSKYADPTEGARTGLSIAEAEEVALEDPSLIWVRGGRPSWRVQPVETGADWMEAQPCLPGVRVSSRTAAVQACRDAGYRVMTVGGLVERSTIAGGSDEDVWTVTVHPERHACARCGREALADSPWCRPCEAIETAGDR